jgi:hypothetical protein
MPPKKNKAQEKNTNNKNATKVDKYVLLRDSSTQMLFILQLNDVSTSKTSKIRIGTDVMYATADRNRGRGTIILIG